LPLTDEQHAEIAALLPWYVNGTLDDSGRHRLDRHLDTCATCRADLQLDLQIQRRVSSNPSVEFIPTTASLQRLNQALDALSQEAAEPSRTLRDLRPARRGGRPALFAAAAALIPLAVGIGVLGSNLWKPSDSRFLAPYRTVTTGEPHPADEVIRAVFAPNITISEMQSILDEAGLRIVAGPSAAAVYSLAATSKKPVDASLALLRAHVAVRFAESTQPSPAGPP
jgi:anti-sigma factor RsiW